MAVDRVLHSRQMRVPEIGERGQERLNAGELALVTTGDARSIEGAYLRAAGVGVAAEAVSARDLSIARRSSRTRELLETLSIEDPHARAVAEGALGALVGIAALLGREDDMVDA